MTERDIYWTVTIYWNKTVVARKKHGAITEYWRTNGAETAYVKKRAKERNINIKTNKEENDRLQKLTRSATELLSW
jgi:hypothetical protein